MVLCYCVMLVMYLSPKFIAPLITPSAVFPTMCILLLLFLLVMFPCLLTFQLEMIMLFLVLLLPSSLLFVQDFKLVILYLLLHQYGTKQRIQISRTKTHPT
uniref:Uncharacterized protein n=1 Tax=Cacopsylla melanoneura TaxID=428564 RepID=A0A8D9E9Y6_9HEMI